jgi:hypothetical protein
MDEEKTIQEAIHEKGFDLINGALPTDYNKVKVGVKTVEDATLQLGSLVRFVDAFERRYADKRFI